MAGRPKKTPGEPINEIEYGKTGYPVVYQEEGKEEVAANLISDEDLHEYQQLKGSANTGTFIHNDELHQMQNIIREHQEQMNKGRWVTNDEAAHYTTLKEKESKEAAEAAEKDKQKVAAEEAEKQSHIARLGVNPVYAVNQEGMTMPFSRLAWDNLPWIQEKGEDTNIKMGGWFEKADVPPEIEKLRSNA